MATATETAPDPLVVRRLADLFRRNGYVRRQSAKRLANAGYKKYKKGDEVRLVAETEIELKRIQNLLREAGFAAGNSFVKANQWRVPIYGRAAVARFLALIGELPADDSEG